MKYWVFNEEQLKAALVAWAQQRNAHGSLEIIRLSADMDAVEEFLRSDAAREHKLQGGASYGPADMEGG